LRMSLDSYFFMPVFLLQWLIFTVIMENDQPVTDDGH